MKRFLSLLLSAVVIVNTFAIFGFSTTAYAASYAQTLRNKGFPESYIPYLVSLHEKYPNWVFEPLDTGLDWQTAVNGERSSHGKQLIEKWSGNPSSYYCTCSNCYKNGSYVIREGYNWVAASETAVKYYMDPRNFLNDEYIFQFESTAYDGTQSKAGVEAVLKGTWMYDSLITYYDGDGDQITFSNTLKYSDAIMKAASDSGMSAYYLASKIRQENGGATASATAVRGTASPFTGIYNYFNIGANTGAYQGLAFAAGFMKLNHDSAMYSTYSNGKVGGTKTALSAGQYMSYISSYGDYFKVRLYYENSSNSYSAGKVGFVPKADIRMTYCNSTSGAPSWGRPWKNPYRAIYHGAQYIAKQFANQDSGYLQKFNVSPSSPYKYQNEYMANVAAAASEAKSTYNAYKAAGILSLTKKFEIPVFNNMPASSNGDIGWVTKNGEKYYLDANGDPYKGEQCIDGSYYIFSYKDGHMLKGMVRCDGEYYITSKTTGQMMFGRVRCDGKWYITNKSTGRLVYGKVICDGNYYITDKTNGEILYGKVICDGVRYIMDRNTGVMLYGKVMCDGIRYIMSKSTGEMMYGLVRCDGEYYITSKTTGEMMYGIVRCDGVHYIMSIYSGSMLYGKVRYLGNTYITSKSDGHMIKNEWASCDYEMYYLTGDGTAYTGWRTEGDKKYYFNADGRMERKYVDIDGTTYLFDKNGVLQTSFDSDKALVSVTSATSEVPKKINLTWTKPDFSNSGYQIMWSTDKNFSDYHIKTSGYPSKLDYELTEYLESGKTYYVKVRAYKVAYNGKNERDDAYFPWSDTVSVKVK